VAEFPFLNRFGELPWNHETIRNKIKEAAIANSQTEGSDVIRSPAAAAVTT
jgi:hypothetical protein